MYFDDDSNDDEIEEMIEERYLPKNDIKVDYQLNIINGSDKDIETLRDKICDAILI